jgi:hypothetical protein
VQVDKDVAPPVELPGLQLDWKQHAVRALALHSLPTCVRVCGCSLAYAGWVYHDRCGVAASYTLFEVSEVATVGAARRRTIHTRLGVLGAI